MRKKKKPDGTAMNSQLLVRPIRKFSWLFILPVFACFCIGFVWPFIQGIMAANMVMMIVAMATIKLFMK